MRCAEARAAFDEYLDGTLEEAAARTIEGHLHACSRCREALGETVKYRKVMGSLPRVQVPADFLQQVKSRLYKNRAARPGFARRMRDFFLHPLPLKLPLEVAAVAAVAIALLFTLHVTKPLRMAPKSARMAPKSAQVPPEMGHPETEEGLFRAPAVGSAAPESRKDESATESYASKAEEEDSPGGLPARQPIEITLFLRTPRPETAQGYAEGVSPGASRRARDRFDLAETKAPSSEQTAFAPAEKEKGSSRVAKKALRAESAPEEESARDDRETILEQVSSFIAIGEGRILEIKFRDEREVPPRTTPAVVVAEVPTANLDRIFESLKTLGELEAPPPFPASVGDVRETTVLRILLEPDIAAPQSPATRAVGAESLEAGTAGTETLEKDVPPSEAAESP